MRNLRALWLRLRVIFYAEQANHEFAAKLESHLQMHTEDNLRSGMSPKEARRQALIRLGGIEQTRQTYRERQSILWIEPLWHDVRFGFRMLRKKPHIHHCGSHNSGTGNRRQHRDLLDRQRSTSPSSSLSELRATRRPPREQT